MVVASPPHNDGESSSWLPVASIAIFTMQMIRGAILLVRYVDERQQPTAATVAADGGEESTKTTSNKKKKTTTAGRNQNGGGGGGGEKQPLLPQEEAPVVSPPQHNDNNQQLYRMKVVLTVIWLAAVACYGKSFLVHTESSSDYYLQSIFSDTTTVVLLMEVGLLWTCVRHGNSNDNNNRDYYDVSQRMLQLLMALTVWTVYALSVMKNRNRTNGYDAVVMATIVLASIFWQRYYYKVYRRQVVTAAVAEAEGQHHDKSLSMSARWSLVKPYVWPDETDNDHSAFWNRVRAISTWLCVILSKGCNIISPMFLGWATTALAQQDYYHTIFYSISYCVISWCGTTFKELQSLLYLKVAQAAFVQLAAAAFIHLHGLSLDWHLKKQLGGVLRSMDRGIAACDTLMTYLFLWLLPALAECTIVCGIFAVYFSYVTLAVAVFYFVFVYVVTTIVVTLWRKKFRKALTTSDNDWHDKVTDSLVNFETVKCFTAEAYELSRFRAAVATYQAGSVNVQGSLSLLNISQQVILKACLATALTLAVLAIRDGRMQVGDFVAVLTYTLNLFAPLNFLGSVYNAIVMATIDLSNMSELLAENPDVVDAPDALELPPSSSSVGGGGDNDNDIAVEFDNVHFHYPTQSADRGLKGLSFKMKRGTTTAIVGPTGAGKTTVSRLLFRFYDVLGGAVKVHGRDVRSVTQHSLRSAIGVVPQTASMFNDTIRNNIHYGNRNATAAQIIQAAADAQLLPFIESLTEGWDTMVGDRGLKLSGGERQRAAIARCLLKNPPIVLLDEATSALDTITENSVQEALDRLGRERTVLVIAHRLGTIRHADQIVVLKDGIVAERGTHDELLQIDNGVYADMWNMQLHSTATASSTSTSREAGLDLLAG